MWRLAPEAVWTLQAPRHKCVLVCMYTHTREIKDTLLCSSVEAEGPLPIVCYNFHSDDNMQASRESGFVLKWSKARSRRQNLWEATCMWSLKSSTQKQRADWSLQEVVLQDGIIRRCWCEGPKLAHVICTFWKINGSELCYIHLKLPGAELLRILRKKIVTQMLIRC